MTQEKNTEAFEKRVWFKGDRPGASDFNRIENGIESAHEHIKQLEVVAAQEREFESQEQRVITINADDLVERIKQISKLEPGAKVADLVVAFNDLLDALTGADEGVDNGEDSD